MDVSVIIPIYNVSDFLKQCLDSVAAATGSLQAEVLLIDDGSTDDSGIIAGEYAVKDARFLCFHKENGGLGSARNYGVQRASGKYLMFIDSDDMIEPDCLVNMFSLAERTHSDLTLCNMARFDSQKTSTSTLAYRTFCNMPESGITHITANRNLFFDTIVCNKLILQSFYLEHGFSFPENRVFEDIPVAMRMHYFANRVACMNKTGYLWRIREGESRSITQSNDQLKNLTDRLSALEDVFSFFGEKGNTELLENLQYKTLKVDLMIYINVLKDLPDELAYTYINLLNDFIELRIDKRIVGKLPATQRQRYEYLFSGDLDGIRKTIDYNARKISGTKVIRKNGRYYFDLPKKLFTIKDHSAWKDYRDKDPDFSTDRMTVNENVIMLETHLFNPKIPVEKEDDLQMEASLIGDITRRKIPLSVVREKRKSITERYGAVFNENSKTLDHYEYDFSGFRLTIDLDQISRQSLLSDNYYISVHYKTAVSEGNCLLRKALQRYYEKYADSIFVTASGSFSVIFDPIKQFFLRFEKNQEKEAEIRKNLMRNLLFSRRDRTRARVLFEDGSFFIGGSSKAGRMLSEKKESLPVWKSLNRSGESLEYTLDYYTSEKGIHWVDIVSESIGTGMQQRLSRCSVQRWGKRYTGKGTIRLDPEALAVMTAGEYVVFASPEGGRREEILSLESFDHESFPDTFSLYFLAKVNGGTVLRIFNEWPAGEKSRAERTYIRKVEYPEYRKKPLCEKTVLFEFEDGSGVEAASGEICEMIRSSYAGYTCVFSLKDPRMPVPGEAIRVRKGSGEYYRYLATAEYLVSNTGFERSFIKRDGQKLLQTAEELRQILPQ